MASGFEAINLFKSQVRANDQTATFIFSLPRWAGLGSIDCPNWATPLNVTFTSTTVRQLPFSVAFWLEFDKATYPFGIKTDNPAANTAQNLETKFKEHFKDFATQLPLCQRLPNLSYNTDDPMACFFELELPPRTSFYTSNPLLFQGLNMDKDIMYIEAMRPIAPKNRNPTMKAVYGFFNAQGAPMLVQGNVIGPGTSIDVMVREGKKFPAMTICQIEMLNTAPLQLLQLPGEPRVQLASRDNAVRVLQLVFDHIRRALHLSANMIDVTATAEEVVSITNRSTQGAGVTLCVQMNGELAEAVGLGDRRLLEFPLDTVRTIDMRFRSADSHPFSSTDFPVIVRAFCHGNATSYVQGVGEMTILAILDEKEAKFPVLSSGLLFSSDMTYLTVQFLDRHFLPITFTDGYEIAMIVKFRSL